MKAFFYKKMVFCLSVLLVSGHSYARLSVNLTNGEWPPYLSQHLNDNGFASAVVSESFKAVGVDVNYGFYPWKRAYHYAKEGKGQDETVWNGSVVWFYSSERADHFYYSEPVIVDDGVLYYLKSRPVKWKTVEDLRGLVLGGTAHTLYEKFEKAEKAYILRIDRAGNYEALFDRLLAGRIDAIPHVKTVADYFLHTRYSSQVRDKITYSPTVFDKRIYHLILNKKVPDNERYLTLFNEGLKRIKSNGVYQRLHELLDNGYFYY